MIILGRLLVRLLSFLLLLVLAVVGLAAAVFCVQGGRATLSLTHLAALVHLPQFRATLGTFLGSLEASGPVAIIALLCAIGAVLLGLVLLAGLLTPTRQWTVTLEREGEAGAISARRRALAAVAQTLALSAPGVTEARARARPRRTSGGKLQIRAARSRSVSEQAVRADLERVLEPLTGEFALTPKITTRLGESGDRVQ